MSWNQEAEIITGYALGVLDRMDFCNRIVTNKHTFIISGCTTELDHIEDPNWLKVVLESWGCLNLKSPLRTNNITLLGRRKWRGGAKSTQKHMVLYFETAQLSPVLPTSSHKLFAQPLACPPTQSHLKPTDGLRDSLPVHKRFLVCCGRSSEQFISPLVTLPTLDYKNSDSGILQRSKHRRHWWFSNRNILGKQ